MVVWITGRPAAGKTTLAHALAHAFAQRGARAEVIDSDEVRRAVTPAPTYSLEERMLVYRAIAYVALRLEEAGSMPIVAATAHDPALREAIRAVVPHLFLVHARCAPEVAEARDPKGLYKRARATERGSLPGVHVPYVAPADADATVDTDREYQLDDLVLAILERSARDAGIPA